ncbi:hypothetical protein IQ254_23290 [Nodosilinea sp. LEGE 07088]|nr:hypothetical protein [Nodosilinea sp. LEGE 07088]
MSNPDNVPIFLGDLIKSSTGPALAFILSLFAFRCQENRRQEKESKSVRSLLEMEINHNFSEIERLIKNYDKMTETLAQPGKHDFVFAPHGIETQVFSALTEKLFPALSLQELKDVYSLYSSFKTAAYAYENFQPKELRDQSKTNRNSYEWIAKLLRGLQDQEDNPLNK